MAWRGPYNKTLCEMFPQVDVRIIKGTVLDHGSDLASAVEFIMNEVLTPEELKSASNESLPPGVFCILDSEEKPSTCDFMQADQSQQQQEELHPPSENELPGPEDEIATIFLSGANTGTSFAEQGCTEQGLSAPFSSELLRRWLCEEADVKEQPVTDDTLSEKFPSSVASLHESTEMLCSLGETSQFPEQGSKGHDGDTDSEDEGANGIDFGREKVSFSEEVVRLKKLLEGDSLEHSSISSGASSLSSGPSYKGYVCQPTYDVKDSGKVGLQNCAADASTLDHFGPAKGTSSEPDDDLRALSVLARLTSSFEAEGKLEHASNDVCDSHVWAGMPSYLLGASEFSKEENYSSVYSNLQDAMPTDAAMCESLNHSSSQAASIENLDQVFQHARNEKDDLIAAIDDIRLLRQELEKADVTARQSKAEAANGGVDILAKAQELRELVGQRRQANEIHAGEVYGEKAVLGTEARELRSRLAQVMEEKTKAFNRILQIKAMLQSRLDIAMNEREAAEAEKLEKETRALEVLASEQALFDRVELDSKELEAEADACTKLRDFLIERGSSVDSIQGEVAILCEDVETLMQQVQGGAASSQNVSIQGSIRSRSSKSSWNCLGLEPTAVGSSKSAHNSVEGVSPGVDAGNQTMECSSKDKKIRHVAETALSEQRESSEFIATSASGLSTGSVANSVSSKVVYDWRLHRTPIPSHVGSARLLNPVGEKGDQAPTLPKCDLPTTSGGESTGDSIPTGFDIHDAETKERLTYEARMAILPGASLFGAPMESVDMFRETKRHDADNDGWQIL